MTEHNIRKINRNRVFKWATLFSFGVLMDKIDGLINSLITSTPIVSLFGTLIFVIIFAVIIAYLETVSPALQDIGDALMGE